MDLCGFRHVSPPDPALATGAAAPREPIDPLEVPRERLTARGRGCLS